MPLAARYAAGLPLWHNDDCYDHGPGSVGNLFVDNSIAGDSDGAGVTADEDFEIA